MKKVFHFPALLIGLSMVYQSCKIISKVPTVPVQVIPYTTCPVSQVNVNVEADLTNQIAAADQAIPRNFSGSDHPCGGVNYDYEVRRDPISFNGSANTIDYGLSAHFGVNARMYTCLFGHSFWTPVSGSCGFGDGDPGFNIGFRSMIDFSPNYHLKTSTSLTAFNGLGSCPMGVIRWNALPTIQRVLTPSVSPLAAKIDEKLAALDFTPDIYRMWVQLNKELPISNLGFLNINPLQMNLSNLNISGKELTVNLGLSCTPTLNTVSNPSPPVPMPDLSTCNLGNGFNISTDLLLAYGMMSNLLNKQIAGKTIKIGNRKFEFTEASIYGKGKFKTYC